MAAPKITESRSRLAYSRRMWREVQASAVFSSEKIGVMPLPAPNATRSPVARELEEAGGCGDLDEVVFADRVDHPVRDDAVRHPLHRDLQRFADAALDDIE